MQNQVLIAPDQITYLYLKNKKYSPQHEYWDNVLSYWSTLRSDDNVIFDKNYSIDISNISPQVTWGTNPDQVISIDEKIPEFDVFHNITKKQSAQSACHYMDLKPGMFLTNVPINTVFIGFCTNSHIEDLRSAAAILKNKKFLIQ